MVNNRRGRPRGAATARERLLDAAQRHFDEGDLAELSSRDLADEVGVSHSLVNYHFGSRDGLLAAAVSLRIAPHEVVAGATRPDGTLDLPRMVRGLVSVWEHPVHGARLVQSARELAGGGAHASALAAYLQHTVFDTLFEIYGQERARRMATAIVGVIFGRYVLGLPALTALTPAQVATHLVGMLR